MASDRRGASGMAARSEVKVLTQGPDRGNLTPTRQGHWPGGPGRTRPRKELGLSPARGCAVEVIGVQPCRVKAKRRKALWAGEPASSGEAQFLSGSHRVVATGRLQNLVVLPVAFCRVPRER